MWSSMWRISAKRNFMLLTRKTIRTSFKRCTFNKKQPMSWKCNKALLTQVTKLFMPQLYRTTLNCIHLRCKELCCCPIKSISFLSFCFHHVPFSAFSFSITKEIMVTIFINNDNFTIRHNYSNGFIFIFSSIVIIFSIPWLLSLEEPTIFNHMSWFITMETCDICLWPWLPSWLTTIIKSLRMIIKSLWAVIKFLRIPVNISSSWLYN